MKRILTIFTLLVVFSSSGCTVPLLNIEIPFLPDIFPGMNVQEQRHDVISVEGLQAIPSSIVRSDHSIRLRAVVKNLQEPEYEPKENVEIQLFNDCGIFDTTVEFCQGNMVQATNACKLSKMHPQSTAIVEWKLLAKEVNVETACKVGVLAKYNHRTHSTTSVTFINKAVVERLVSEGKGFSETGRATVGEGPVKPYIEVLSQPIIIDPAAASAGIWGSGIMSLYIENKGNGQLYLTEAEKGNVAFDEGSRKKKTGTSDHIDIYLNIGSASGGGTAGTSGTETIIIAEKGTSQKAIEGCIMEHLETAKDSGEYSVNFIGKSTPKYSCSITVASNKIDMEKTHQINAEIDYLYKFVKEITITVQPKIKI